MLSRKKTSAGDYPDRVKALRHSLALTQHDFAALLQVRPQVVASWEQGRKQPSAKNYQRLASLSPLPEEQQFFLSKTGMTPELIRKLVPGPAPAPGSPEIRISTTDGWKQGSQESSRYQVRIPVLRDEAAASSLGEIQWRDIDCYLAVPEHAVPKGPGAYTGVYVHGDSMEPILPDGFTVVLDHTRKDLEELRGRVVAVLHQGAVLVKLLTRESQPDRLILRSYNPEHPEIVIESPHDSRIIGDVVFWDDPQRASSNT